jgi:hypothetical protein
MWTEAAMLFAVLGRDGLRNRNDRRNRNCTGRATPIFLAAKGIRNRCASYQIKQSVLPHGAAYELNGIFDAELVHDVGAVKLHRARADLELARGLFAGGAPDNLSQDDFLLGSEKFATRRSVG